MPYIGNIPPSEFRTIDYQDFTGVTGSPVKRGFTLTSPVGSANDLEIFVNNVRQEPGVAYTVAGTALTMTGDVETSDDFYVVYQGKAVASVVPTDGSVGTAKIADDAVTSAKLDTNIAISGNLDVGTIRSANGTTAATIDSSGRVLQPAKPAFRGFKGDIASADYTTETDITGYTESFDIGGNFNHTTGIFTAPVDGLYQINFMITAANTTTSTNLRGRLYIDGVELIKSRHDPQGGAAASVNYSSVINLTSGNELKISFDSDTDTSVAIDDIDFSGFLVG